MAVTANFSATPTTGDANIAVSFTDTSLGTPTAWLWDFGDAQFDPARTSRNPTHTYIYPGVYTVSLTVYDVLDEDTETKIEYIHINLVASVTKFEYIVVAAAGYTLDIAPPPIYRPMYQTGSPTFSFTTKGVRVYIRILDTAAESNFRRTRGPTLIFD